MVLSRNRNKQIKPVNTYNVFQESKTLDGINDRRKDIIVKMYKLITNEYEFCRRSNIKNVTDNDEKCWKYGNG